MGFLDLFKKKNNAYSTVATATVDIPVESPLEKQNTVVIDMSKHEENLNTVLIDMSKNNKIDMSKHVARVGLVMDYSVSMMDMFRDGSVQDVVTRLLPIALRFDDNGQLESWLFSNGVEKLEAVDKDNYSTYVEEVMMESGMAMGSTNYAPALKSVVRFYKDVEPSTTPSFVMFITDGDNWDTKETNKVVKELSEYNIFIQFVGIGDDKFTYLKSLDNMEGRKHDNTGFIAVKDICRMSDNELYTAMLRQYNNWLANK